jgi:hypothetical protein
MTLDQTINQANTTAFSRGGAVQFGRTGNVYVIVAGRISRAFVQDGATEEAQTGRFSEDRSLVGRVPLDLKPTKGMVRR